MTKTCTMCGGEKSLEEFRKYPGDTDKRYPYCLECQRIEQRRRYLTGMEQYPGLSVEQQNELDKIRELYKLREAKGLKTFGKRSKERPVTDLVDKQMRGLS